MKPIALTMGDPSGIGPEIVMKLMAEPGLNVPALVIGDVGVLNRAAVQSNIALEARAITLSEFRPDASYVQVLAVTELPEDLPLGKVQAQSGQAAFDYVKTGIEAALAGEVSALVTAPIHKEAMRLAGLPYPGHTEILADLSQSDDYTMMMSSDDLRVVLVTIHESLKNAIELVTTENILRSIRLAHTAMVKAGMDPKNIKYLVFGHYHGDHTGGGRYLQKISGAKAVQHWADWELYLRPYQNPNRPTTGRGGAPLDPDDLVPMTRDIEATDGMQLTIGNRQKVTVTIYQMTGHTPGSLGMIVPVRYENRDHPILIVTAGNAFPNINAFIGGYEHIWDIGIQRRVESVMQAHPNTNMNLLARTKYVNDNYGKIPKNPLLYGPERTAKYINIVRACSRAHIALTGML